MTSLPHPFSSRCGRETNNLVCVALDKNQLKINDRVVLNPEADILWNVCVQNAASLYKLLSSLLTLSDLRRISSIICRLDC